MTGDLRFMTLEDTHMEPIGPMYLQIACVVEEEC